VASRIARAYGRTATVIAPPVDTSFFTPAEPSPPPLSRGYYFTASRWVPYKRIDLIVAAFGAMPGKRLIVAGDGPDAATARAASGANVEWAGRVSRERMRELLRGARAFVFAAEEDFGILPVEAQACGTPVIAYGRGGATETVRTPSTGLFFDAQTPEAIAGAVARFESMAGIDPRDCRAQAQGFSTDRFVAAYTGFVEGAWDANKAAGDNPAPWPAAS
jgi:glycosyltransferase involved in cell wall biosynthesis